MDIQRFETMVARLERDSAVHPRAYLVRVAALALAGYALLAVLVGVAGFGLLVLVGIAIAALWTGGGALVLLLKLGKLLIFLAVPLWFLVKSAVSALFVRLPVPAGRPLTRHESPALFAAIDAMRARLRGPKVHHVLLVDDMNAAIVQRPLFGLIGVPRNYLMLGLPLLECMTPEEALAVVAHEYGH
ncbi:MAG TPA: M48 family metallopeptidase, partial [Burkholderiaceae bacterium]|nr:M48 family metallopeptidase [Burkholderiaceae bacterium]